jgi:hypothetical protein
MTDMETTVSKSNRQIGDTTCVQSTDTDRTDNEGLLYSQIILV